MRNFAQDISLHVGRGGFNLQLDIETSADHFGPQEKMIFKVDQFSVKNILIMFTNSNNVLCYKINNEYPKIVICSRALLVAAPLLPFFNLLSKNGL